MSSPMFSEHFIGGSRQGNEAVLGPLAPMDVDHHPAAVDIGYLQMQGFGKSKSAGIDGFDKHQVAEGADTLENLADFILTENLRQFSFDLGSQIVEQMPIPFEDIGEKESDSTIVDPHGRGRPVAFVSPIKEVALQLFFGDQIGGFDMVIDQHPDGPGIALLGSFALAGQLKGIHGFLIPVFHHCVSP